jgi:hypothetical protein
MDDIELRSTAIVALLILPLAAGTAFGQQTQQAQTPPKPGATTGEPAAQGDSGAISRSR